VQPLERSFTFGALVCNSPTFAQMSQENYERPQEYWPERWLGTDALSGAISQALSGLRWE
jgi:hypothetical protein